MYGLMEKHVLDTRAKWQWTAAQRSYCAYLRRVLHTTPQPYLYQISTELHQIFNTGNHERGWNDPPQFLYDAQKQAGPISSSNPLSTHKRLGHDLSNMNSAPVSAVSHSGAAPPSLTMAPTATLAPVQILNMPSKDTSTAGGDNSSAEVDTTPPDITDDSELCQYCVRCFTECSERLREQNIIEEKLSKDVIKRIGMFEKAWKSQKISAGAKPLCAQLSRALEVEAYKQADEVHLKLMTDHISEVSIWIIGIKKLIQSVLIKS